MAAYTRAHVMKASVFKVEDVDYANQVTSVLFTPDTPIQQLRTLSPTGTVTDVDSAVWTLELEGVQDFGTGSLGKALRDAAGTIVEVEFQPVTGTGQDKIVAQVVATDIPFGGTQGEFRTFSITLPVEGTPVFSQSA